MNVETKKQFLLSWGHLFVQYLSMTGFHCSACIWRSLRCCSPTCCTGPYNVQAMLKSCSLARDGGHHDLLFFTLRSPASLLCNYACNWHTRSYLYRRVCCPTAKNLVIGAAAFLGQTVDHRHTHTHLHRQIFYFSAKCFHWERWRALFAWLLFFLSNLNINMTHSKWWCLHWLKMAGYL